MRAMVAKRHGAVIVTRVSTGEQVLHGTSLEDQLEACRAKATALMLPIVAEYQDAGISGALLLSRGGMQSALADIREGRADTLICANISRYSREVEHQQQIRKQVRLAGGRVVFCDMHFEDTPEGELAFDIVGGFAAYERKAIRDRTMRGKKRRAKAGQQPQRSRSPYGYHIVTHSDIIRGSYPGDMLGRYVLDPETAPIAKWMFECYATGSHSYSQLCKELNRRGVASPGSASAWHAATVRLLLTNPVYKGEPVSGRIRRIIDENRLLQRHRLTGDPITTPEIRYLAPESEWIRLSAPALVSGEVWDAVQERISRMAESSRGSSKQMRMLSGLTYCPHCGCRAKIRYQKADGVRYEYLRCSAFGNARDKAGPRPCRGDVYRLGVVEEALVRAITSAIEHPAAVQEALSAYRASLTFEQEDAASEQRDLERALEQLRTEEAAAIRAQIAGIRSGASPEAYAAVFADIAARRKDVENRLGEIARVGTRRSQPADTGRKDTLQKALTDTRAVLLFDTVPGREKHDTVMQVVQKVVCRKEGAEVVFVPGLFGENEDDPQKSIVHTTCIGIKTQK